ncbi:hypothetical protein BO79DRAFT_284013 [Aspergillus costaricaensis CBS 115574]|uniref:Uncharacterized protein n=1 Tax=Aspergillus costaricaensis CBS 115574 TaxID=1448317 RepID=A0ACD1IRY9_9EURO|nr:hypothetical protein BO79DRAFT_284013 [Aspergillus costaricaensis CBS 115574]RAK93355.1 hypothetical protein BO79DRAFT_284013 [Aspergillus costaricaensis CBS 115574]
MSRNIIRTFQTSSAAAIQHIGAELAQVRSLNGANGNRWTELDANGSQNHFCGYLVSDLVPLLSHCRSQTKISCRGAKAHVSSKDRSDPEQVITVGLKTQGGVRVGTLHVHLSGSFKSFPSRAGREGGYDHKIAQANIPGYLAGENDPWEKASPAPAKK